jgi:hypothetical protein
MTGHCAEHVGELLNDYAVRAEDWKVAADEPGDTRELEKTLLLGISLFINIDMIDCNWRNDLFANSAKYEPSQEQEIEGFYRRWLQPAGQILSKIAIAERSGCEVKWADQFRRACREAQALLTSDSDFFTGDALTEKRDAAIDAHREGRTVEFHEFGE